MKRTNPLFVDSTKFRGDMILCRIEARTSGLNFDGHMAVRVWRDEEDLIQTPLLEEGNNLWRGQVQLEYQSTIRAQLVMKLDRGLEILGKMEEHMANHILELKWVPPTFKSLEIERPYLDAPPLLTLSPLTSVLLAKTWEFSVTSQSNDVPMLHNTSAL